MLRVSECKSLARRNLSGRYGTVIIAQLICSVITTVIFSIAIAALWFAMQAGNVFHNVLVPNYTIMAAGSLIFTAMLFLGVFLSVFFYYGQIKLMLNLCRGKKYGIGDIFSGFKNAGRAWKVFLIQLAKAAILFVIAFVGNLVQLKLQYDVTHDLGGSSNTVIACMMTVRVVFIIASVIIAIETFLSTIIAVDKSEVGVFESFKRSFKLMKRRQFNGLWFIYFSFIFWHLLALIIPFVNLFLTPYIQCSQVIFYMDADETLWQLPGSKADENARKAGTDGTYADASGDNAYGNSYAGSTAGASGNAYTDNNMTQPSGTSDNLSGEITKKPTPVSFETAARESGLNVTGNTQQETAQTQQETPGSDYEGNKVITPVEKTGDVNAVKTYSDAVDDAAEKQAETMSETAENADKAEEVITEVNESMDSNENADTDNDSSIA